MYQKLDTVTLKSGEPVEAGVVKGPDPAWTERLIKLLWHKGDPWNWQNARLLEADQGLDAYFYVLHRDGQPLANIMTVENAGVGHFGHVWTEPADRQKGASSLLMALQMAHFTARGGQALFLGTGYDSVAYHMYRRFGFQSIEPQSGYMAYYRTSQADFEARYFAQPAAADDLVIQPLAWPHWPASAALFLGDFPGVMRCVRGEIVGRESSEGGLLPLLLEAEQRQQEGKAPRSFVLYHRATNAVLGFATGDWHPHWPGNYLLDLYCHPAYWEQAPALLNALPLPSALRTIIYADSSDQAKQNVLMALGFQLVATLPRWLVVDPAHARPVDVLIFAR
ncbi:MAG: hypothetical protein DYG89_51275 [Caldilinea sp. CFX5]|nr:hypothetical protein [Caldilinea sp. CFX5]